MTTHDFTTLSLLGDSDLTVADGEEDIRGRTVKANLQEIQRGQPEPNLEEVDRLEQELDRIGERERRLVKLYSYGEIDEDLVQPGLTEFKRQRAVIEARLRDIRPNLSPAAPALPDAGLLDRACRAVGDFLDNAGPEERTLALEALQIAVRVTTTEAEITGIVPIDNDSYLHTNSQANACCTLATTLVSNQIRRASQRQHIRSDPSPQRSLNR